MIAYLKEHGLKSYKADVKNAPKIIEISKEVTGSSSIYLSLLDL